MVGLVLVRRISKERLRRTADGRVCVTLKRAWRDGTTLLLFEPLEFLERHGERPGGEVEVSPPPDLVGDGTVDPSGA